MTQLDINGTKIQIGDEFLKLSPQAQDDFVKNTIVPSAEFKAAQAAGKPKEKSGALSEIGKAYNPLEIAKEIGRSASEGLEKIEALKGRGGKGPIEGLLDTGSAVLGAGEVLLSPVTGLARNYGGHLLTAAEIAAGKGINALTGWNQEPDPEKMYDEARGDIDKASMAVRPHGAPVRMPGVPRGPAPETPLGGPRRGDIPLERPAYEYPLTPEAPPQAPTAPAPGTPVTEMGRRQGVDVPRVLSTESQRQQQLGQFLSKQSFLGGGQIGAAIENVPVQIAARRGAIAEQLGPTRTAENVGADIRSTLEGAAGAETQAAKTAAQQADEVARANWERTNAQRTQAIEGYEAQSARETGQQVGPAPTTTGMGDTIVDTVRASHDVARGRKDAAYREAGEREGTVWDSGNSSAIGIVDGSLRSDTGRGRVTLSPHRTPGAVDMRDRIAQFSREARQRQAAAQNEAIAQAREEVGGRDLTPQERTRAIESAEPTGQNLRAIEDVRKDLNSMYPSDPADMRAANRIMRGFDEWQARVMGGRHYEGDPEALPSFLRARALNRDLMQRYGYNNRHDEDKIIQRIVRDGRTDHIGPNDVADLLSAKPDKAGRVMERIYEAAGDHPNRQTMHQAIRGGLFEKANAPLNEKGAPRTREAIAGDLHRLTSGQREGLASRVYEPEDIALIRRHAQALRAGERARTQTAELATATEPTPTEVPKGPSQQLRDAVIGGGHGGDEALVKRIIGYATSKGSPADIRKLADVMRHLPENLKKDFLNQFISTLGNGPDGKFSAKVFADAWQNHISSRMKTLLTGGSSEHAKALDDLAGIARQYDDVHKRFGNPTGSGHIANFAQTAKGLVTGMLGHAFLGPIATVGGWLGVAGYSRFLSKPAGAMSVARFARQMKKFQDSPTIGSATATKMAARNLRNTAISLGLDVTNFPEPKK